MATGDLPNWYWRPLVTPVPLPKEAEVRLTQKKAALAFLAYQNQRSPSNIDSTKTSTPSVDTNADTRQFMNVQPPEDYWRFERAVVAPKGVDLRDIEGGVPLPLGAWGKLNDEGQFKEEAERDLKMIEAEEKRIREEAAKLQQRQRELEQMKLKRKDWEQGGLQAVNEKQQRLKEAADRAMVGPAPAELAFSSRHDFKAQRSTPSGSNFETLSSRPREESFLSYSYRMNRERLSLHESAPGSRWPQRLSAQRNCGFAGGVGRGLRRDAVNDEEERDLGRSPRTVRRRRMVAVPQGLQDAMRRRTRKGNEAELDGEGSEGNDEEYFSAEEDEHWSDEQTSELDTLKDGEGLTRYAIPIKQGIVAEQSLLSQVIQMKGKEAFLVVNEGDSRAAKLLMGVSPSTVTSRTVVYGGSFLEIAK